VVSLRKALLENAGNARRNGAPVGVLMGSQAGTLIKGKRLDFLWFLWLTEVVIIEKNLLMPW